MRVTLPHDPSRLRAGERRHPSVLFCDLVGSTRFTERLDPEDWGEIVAEYHSTCQTVVRRFDGHVAAELGDGLIAYFGWPVAHEDDAYRAVRTGLEAIDSMQTLNAKLERQHGVRLQVRIGIDTGTVVVGQLEGPKRGERATGSTLHVASRIQEQAPPDSVVISGRTLDLVRDYIVCEDLGFRELKHVEHPVHLHRVVGLTGVAHRLDAALERDLTPFIAREFELAALLDLWDRTRVGASATVYVSGEPGIGKSRLVRTLGTRVSNAIVFRCSPLNANSALFPVISRLQQLLDFDRLASAEQKLERLDARLHRLGFAAGRAGPLLASELAVPVGDGHRVSGVSSEERRQILDLLVEWLLREAQHRPLLAVWEDLHWADPSTLELLGLVLARAGDVSMLTLLTFRPEFEPPWARPVALTEFVLGRLHRADVETMLISMTGGRPLPAPVVNHIVEKTDGVPLFVEELLQSVLDSGVVREERDRYIMLRPASQLAIPETLQDSLLARLDRLGPTAKAVAQRGAILGRSFSEELMREVLQADVADEQVETIGWPEAEQCLARLVAAGVLRRRSVAQTTYEFKHALIQEAAYESLLRRIRQAHHLQTAHVLETKFSAIAEAQPELVAHHYTEALDFEKALPCWQQAGERARDHSANPEAVHHFDQALAALAALPDGEARDRRELALRVASLTPLIAVEGYVAGKTVETVDRALALGRKLGQRLGDVPGLFSVLYAQWVTRLVRGDYDEALRLSDDFLREAEGHHDAAPRLTAERLRGFSHFSMGERNLAVAREHLDASLGLYDPRQHTELKNQGYGQDPRCACEAFLALVRWLQGYPEEAAEWSHLALAHAREASHSNTWGYALCFGGATFEVFRQEALSVERHGSALMAFAEKEGLPVWLSYARVLHGWALVQADRVAEGVAQMKKGLADFAYPSVETAGVVLGRPAQGMGFMKSFLLSLLAEAHARIGQAEEGLSTIDMAWSFADANREGFWKAELQRLKGELLLQARSGVAAPQEAEACFMRALAIASAQGARSLELRAAMSLARLWRRGNPQEGRRILLHASGTFTEGFDSKDLREARRLLMDLSDAAGAST